MRKQIAAANWKMNLTYQQGEKLLDEILQGKIQLESNQQVIFAVPFPYLIMAKSEVSNDNGYAIAAQNCSDKKNGAYTGEVAAEMLQFNIVLLVIVNDANIFWRIIRYWRRK
jgi:triosephosphate isomerase (TIM)